MHHRQVDIRFYKRSDGRYEVEGRLVDTKNHAFRRQLAEEDSPPGTKLHDITVTLVVDDALVVHDARAAMNTTPFTVCGGAADTLAPLKGLSIGSGWNKRVRELLGGRASCTHIVELLGPMATTAFQGLAPQRLERLNDPANEEGRRKRVDSCFAYAAEREVVARLWPHLHKPQ
ncbi:DUF2889 domain-containing protein [Ramlibacter sp. PS4R-6]|uniref:DUF2889 domain-containing protein n=1 Tax=Ramlibacter sp. PS4R-6 TaxID=3133438 RepID=UPI0030B6FBB2